MRLLIIFFLLFEFLIMNFVLGQEIENPCLLCHGKSNFKKINANGSVRLLYVNADELKKSVHSDKKCIDCHSDIVSLPHPVKLTRVVCSQCHYKGNLIGAPQSDRYNQYMLSIHGRRALQGDTKAPLCQDCHGSHNILPSENSKSSINKKNIAKTCGRCHLEEYADYRYSIHSLALLQGKKESAACTDCHGEHNISSIKDPLSNVYVSKIPKTCSHCHSNKKIMDKYGVRVEQVITYEESFHGIANKFGSKAVATCASCHGYHNILPASDPMSSINKNNLPKTCGKCHPGANINFTKGKIHIAPKKKEAGIVYYISTGFKWLTILVMAGLIMHILLDLTHKARNKNKKK